MIVNSSLPNKIPQLGKITIGDSWSGNDPYTQIVTVKDVTVTENSKIDLQPDITLLSALSNADITAMYVENNGGTLTLYSVGGVITSGKIQCLVTEVSPAPIKTTCTVTIHPQYSGKVVYVMQNGYPTYVTATSGVTLVITVKAKTNILLYNIYSADYSVYYESWFSTMVTSAEHTMVAVNEDSAISGTLENVYIEDDTEITYRGN